MNIDNQQINVGSGVFLKTTTPSGKVKHIACEVLEIMERPPMLKVRYARNKTTCVREWHPANQFTLTIPTEVKP